MKTTNIKEIEGARNFFTRTFLIAKHLKTRMPTMIAVLLVVIWVLYLNKHGTLSFELQEFLAVNKWNDVVSVATLIAVAAVWLAELREDWRQALPKYLTVSFEYDKEIQKHLTSELIMFLHESDVRSLAQSLGQLKNFNKHLNFDHEKQEYCKTISCDTECKRAFYHYKIKFTLKKPPLKERQYQSKEAYLENISNSFKQLIEKTEEDYEKDFVKTIMAKIEGLSQQIKEGQKNDNNQPK